MQYPTRNGLIIPPSELDIAPSRYNPNNQNAWNNHHGYFPKSRVASSYILRTLRNLDAYQYPMLIDQHCTLHADYSEPPMPRLLAAMNRLEQAYETSEPLRTGTIHRPHYEAISIELWSKIIDEYCLMAT